MHISDINRFKYYTFQSLSSQRWISITLSNLMSPGMTPKLFRSMWRDKKDILASLTLLLQLSGLKHSASNNEAIKAFGKRDSASTMEASEPKHVLLFIFLTDSSRQDCSAGHSLLKTTGLHCYRAMFIVFFLSPVLFWVVFFLSLCLAVDHIRKTG